jgi:flavodoxin I
MRTIIVYDSVFGNTERVARGIAAALGTAEEVQVLRVSEVKAPLPPGIELLIVGSPTRGFRPTPAIVAFLKRLAKGSLQGVRVAAFDTRISPDDIPSGFLRFIVGRGGYAANPIARRLKGSGGGLTAPPEGFCVQGTEGPLKEGELERAADWARTVRETRSG